MPFTPLRFTNIRFLDNLHFWRSQREQIITNHEKRRDSLARILEETKEKVADHHSGRKLLEDDQIALFEKRVGLYERKLEKMNQPMSDEVR